MQFTYRCVDDDGRIGMERRCRAATASGKLFVRLVWSSRCEDAQQLCGAVGRSLKKDRFWLTSSGHCFAAEIVVWFVY